MADTDEFGALSSRLTGGGACKVCTTGEPHHDNFDGQAAEAVALGIMFCDSWIRRASPGRLAVPTSR